MFDAEAHRGIKTYALLAVFVVMLALTGLILWPEIDLMISNWFYTPGKGFLYAVHPFFIWLHWLAGYGSRILGIVLAALTLIAALRRQPLGGINTKGWLFLFVALVIGPGLIANVILKDHWNRARPHEITEFGGSSSFSPAWIPQQQGHKNDSFIAGDAAFGFYLPSFAYVVPLPKKREKLGRSRRVFWGGIASGAVFGLARIIMGGHFFSDVLFAAFFMLIISATLHGIMFGRKSTAIYWRNWFFADRKKVVTLG